MQNYATIFENHYTILPAETIDVNTGVRSVLKDFDHVIEAPNWTRDGQYDIG